MSTGRYHRFHLHNERAHRQSVLLQRSSNGRPVYVESADFTDWARIVRKQINRLARLHTRGVHGDGSWAILVDPDNPTNNFLLQGGDNTDANAKEAWVGGFCALLHRTVSYDAQRNGEFNDLDAANLHHRASSVAAGQLIDLHSKYTAGALEGMTIHIEGAGDFVVTANTPTTITVDAFEPSDYPNLGARPWYWFSPATVEGADQEQAVYLDVHLEDWGMEEDSQLNHNIGGTPVECARREVLIRRVWVRQNATTAESPIVDYKDSTGTQHYVLFLGTITRRDGVDAIAEDDIDLSEVEVFASSGDEVSEARAFEHFAVGVDHNEDDVVSEQPRSLNERLARQDSWIVVGPTGDPGVYTGADGLRDALAIAASNDANDGAPFTIFLRNGIYSFTTDLVINDRTRIVGESKRAIIAVNMTDVGDAVNIEGRAQLSGLTFLMTRGSVKVIGRSVGLSDLYVLQQWGNIVPAIVFRTELDDHGAVGGSVLSDSTLVSVGALTPVLQCYSDTTVPRFSQNFFSDATNDTLGTASTQDAYGVRIINCQIKRSVSTNSPAVSVNGGGTYLFQNCVFAAHNSPAFSLVGDYAIDNDDARCLVRMVGCDFVAVTGDTDTTNFSLLQQRSGFLSLSGCSFDFQDDESGGDALVRNLPTRMLDIDLGEGVNSDKVGGTTIQGCRVVLRASTEANQYGVRLRARGDNAISVEDLEVHQVEFPTYNTVALLAASAYGGSARIHLSNIRTNAYSVTHQIRLCGNITGAGLYTDSSRRSNSSELDYLEANLYPDIRIASTDTSDVSVDDYLVSMDLRNLCCTNPPYCGLGFKGAGMLSHRVSVDGLIVNGIRQVSAVSGYGCIIQHFNNVSLTGAKLHGLRFSGVVDVTECAVIQAEVSGFAEYYKGEDNYGLLDADYAKVPAGLLPPTNVAGVVGGRTVRCVVYPNPLLADRTGGIGHVPLANSGTGAFTSVSARGATVGVWLEQSNAARIVKIDTQAHDCMVGVLSIRGYRPAIRGEFHGCDRAIFVSATSKARVTGVDASGDGVALFASASADLRVDGLSAVYGQAGSTRQLVILDSCADYLLRNLTLDGGSKTALHIIGSSGRIESSHIAAGGSIDKKFNDTSLVHSLVFSDCTDTRIQQVTADFGIYATGCDGDWDLYDCHVLNGGTILHPGAAAGKLRVIGGEYQAYLGAEGATTATLQPRTCAALWAVPATWEVGNRGWEYVDVEGIDATKPLTNNADFDEAVASSAVNVTVYTSRFATIHVNATYEARVSQCSLFGYNSNLIIGDLTFIAASSSDASECRFGPERVVACDNRFLGAYGASSDHEPLVAVGKDMRCHEIRGNVFRVGGGFDDYNEHAASLSAIRLYSQTHAADDDWTRVIFTGNHAYRGDRFNEPTHLDFMVTFSANVLLDANLAVDAGVGWNAWAGWTADDRRESVVAHNSIRPNNQNIDNEGALG